METKEYMYQLVSMNKEIDEKIMRLGELRTSITGITQKIKDIDIISSRENSFERNMVEILTLENEIDEMIDKRADLKKEIFGMIRKVSTERRRELLYDRYVLGKSISAIAEDYKINVRNAKKLQKEAISEIEKIIHAKSSI